MEGTEDKMGAVGKGGDSRGVLQEGGLGCERGRGTGAEELGEWEKVSRSVKAAAREVCGVVRGK